MQRELNEKLEALLEQVQKPAQYTGGEMNTEIKPRENAELTFAFCFPDTYEIGMSHLGMKILYSLINEQSWSVCERVFMPAPDMLCGLRREGIPLFSWESRTPLSEFDVVGFTLQYEMSFTNILEMLDLGGIPLRSVDRAEHAPIVVAGGPCAFNPEPLAPFIDAFMIGDGEETMLELNQVIREWKKSGESRLSCLKKLAALRGVYVPALYDVSYYEDGTIASFVPNCPEAPNKVVKAIVTDFDRTFAPKKIVVPYTEIVFDRIMLEIMRGCTAGCRFCQAGILYRPVRERSVETLLQMAEELEKSTGYEEMSLSSLSSGDYSCITELTKSLNERFSDKRVSISLPSLRLTSPVQDSLNETQRVHKTSLTFAPEAGTQRLRDVINKGVTMDDVVTRVTECFSGGWSAIKFYFMIGLPTETYEDLDGIGELAQKAVDIYFSIPKGQRAKGLRVTCSASSFVPKPFTPFQWEAQDSVDMLKEKQAYLCKVLRIKGVDFRWHAPDVSFLEACVARGDRRMADVIETAWRKGCKLDGWNDSFLFDSWMEAFKDCELDPAFYANRVREKDEILPWDFIDAGVTKEFLWREHEKAMQGQVTPDCRKGCQGCGLQRMKGVCKACE